MEQADADGEDHVEAPVAEVERLERRDEELGRASLDVHGVATRRGRDHLRRAVDRGQLPAVEPLAHERRRDAVAAQPISSTQVAGADPRARRRYSRSRSLTLGIIAEVCANGHPFAR